MKKPITPVMMPVAVPIALCVARGSGLLSNTDAREKCRKDVNTVIVVSDPATNAVSNALGGKGFCVLTPAARKMSAPTIPESKIPHNASSTF